MPVDITKDFVSKLDTEGSELLKTLNYIKTLDKTKKKTTLRFAKDLTFSKMWLIMAKIRANNYTKANGKPPKYIDEWKDAYKVLEKSNIIVEFDDDRKKQYLKTNDIVLKVFFDKLTT